MGWISFETPSGGSGGDLHRRSSDLSMVRCKVNSLSMTETCLNPSDTPPPESHLSPRPEQLQRPAKMCASSFAKQGIGRVRQKSQARAGRNISQPRTIFLAELCIPETCIPIPFGHTSPMRTLNGLSRRAAQKYVALGRTFGVSDARSLSELLPT